MIACIGFRQLPWGSYLFNVGRFMKSRMTHVAVLLIALAFIAIGCSSDGEKKASHLEKGETYFEIGEYKSAELEFRNAIQIDPEFVDAYERLGETYLKLGDPRGAFRNTAWLPNSIRNTPMPHSSWPLFICWVKKPGNGLRGDLCLQGPVVFLKNFRKPGGSACYWHQVDPK